jgi:Ca-activated chloride channel family protein
MKQLILSLLMILNGSLLFAQDAKSYIHEGNKLYQQKKYKEAEEAYRKAAAKQGQKVESNFNLGDALYKEKKFDSANNAFKTIASSSGNALVKAEAYHNLGNALLTNKKYDASIDAYKKALLNNPKDDQTRYNLAYAEEMLKKQPPKNNNNQNKNNNNQNKNNPDKNKNNQDKNKGGGNNKNKDKGDKDKNNQDKNNSGNNDQSKANPKNQPSQPNNVSKDDAQRMLDALDAQEKGTQDKLKGKRLLGVKAHTIKDW